VSIADAVQVPKGAFKLPFCDHTDRSVSDCTCDSCEGLTPIASHPVWVRTWRARYRNKKYRGRSPFKERFPTDMFLKIECEVALEQESEVEELARQGAPHAYELIEVFPIDDQGNRIEDESCTEGS